MGQEFYGPHALTDDSKTRSVSRTNDGQKMMWYVDPSDPTAEVGVNDEDLVKMSDTWFVAVKLAPPPDTITSATKIFLRTRFGMNACYSPPNTVDSNTIARHLSEAEQQLQRRRLAFLNAMPATAYERKLASMPPRALSHSHHHGASAVATNKIISECQQYIEDNDDGLPGPTLDVALHRKPSMPSELSTIVGSCAAAQKVWCYQTHYMCDKERNGLALKPAPSVCMELQGWGVDGEAKTPDPACSLTEHQSEKLHNVVCALAPGGKAANSNFGDEPLTFPKAAAVEPPCEPVHFACETPECYLTARPLACECVSDRDPSEGPECQLRKAV
jgi:hypothetical protein